MSLAPVRSRSGLRVVDALNAEWNALTEGNRDAVQGWAARQPALAACGDLSDVLRAAPLNLDGVLSALLAEQLEGPEDLASRTVLQIMLGRVVLLA
ncbi:MAG TPA: hypothetical protein VF635_04595, partial [Propionibacteriaceae bacterium]